MVSNFTIGCFGFRIPGCKSFFAYCYLFAGLASFYVKNGLALARHTWILLYKTLLDEILAQPLANPGPFKDFSMTQGC